jgi:hypothetical protein
MTQHDSRNAAKTIGNITGNDPADYATDKKQGLGQRWLMGFIANPIVLKK